jgi:hypothetical protein
MQAAIDTRSLSTSIVLHAGLLLFAAVGLPALLPDQQEPEPLVMTVELLPISAMTNVRPSEKAIQKETESAKPAPPKPEAKPFTPPPQEKVEPVFDPTQPAPPKDEPKEKPKAQEDIKFEDVLKNLAKESDKTPVKDAKDKTTTEANATQSDAPYDESLPLSISEKDAIRNQFIKCWRMPAGSKDAGNLAVRLRVKLNPDGSLIASELASDLAGRYGSDPFFRAAVDSAKRAVVLCTQPPFGPLKDLPADKYGAWRDMELNFDPSQLLY